MATNATFTWTAQSGIVAQEVWYGRVSDVGSTLPPAAGWNPGANLYPATANSASLNGLDENTNYLFLVRSACSIGNSVWSSTNQYKLVCPAISTTSHSSSVDISLSVLNPAQFSQIVNTLTISVISVSSGSTVATANYSGISIVSPISVTFQGLTASTQYNAVVSYQLTNNGPSTICSSVQFTTSPVASCPVLTFTTSNITTAGFTVTPSGLSVGDTYDISTDGGNTFTIVNASQPSQAVTGLSPNQTYAVVLRHNCTNSTSSVTPAQNVTTTYINFNVTDVWYSCSPSGASCSGAAVYATTATIKRVSDNAVIYTYTNNPSIPNGFQTFVPGIVTGTAYTLTASWTADLTKTNGISQLNLIGNSTSQSYSPSGSTFTASINFTGANTNNIQIIASSLGPVCLAC